MLSEHMTSQGPSSISAKRIGLTRWTIDQHCAPILFVDVIADIALLGLLATRVVVLSRQHDPYRQGQWVAEAAN